MPHRGYNPETVDAFTCLYLVFQSRNEIKIQRVRTTRPKPACLLNSNAIKLSGSSFSLEIVMNIYLFPIISDLVIPWLTCRHIPVIALVMTQLSKLLDVITGSGAVIFGLVIAIAALFQFVADCQSCIVITLNGTIGILAPVWVVTWAGIYNGRPKQEYWQEFHDEI